MASAILSIGNVRRRNLHKANMGDLMRLMKLEHLLAPNTTMTIKHEGGSYSIFQDGLWIDQAPINELKEALESHLGGEYAMNHVLFCDLADAVNDDDFEDEDEEDDIFGDFDDDDDSWLEDDEDDDDFDDEWDEDEDEDDEDE